MNVTDKSSSLPLGNQVIFKQRMEPNAMSRTKGRIGSSSAWDSNVLFTRWLSILSLSVPTNPKRCLDNQGWEGSDKLSCFRRFPVAQAIVNL